MATGLVSAALGIPLSAWYLAGSAEARREAERLRGEPLAEARRTAERVAERLGGRLAALLEAEDRRPFFHYQNLYHDPRGAYGGEAVIPSPLAEGPTDPFIRANFQIDPKGEVTLPTLNEEVPEANGATAPEQARLLASIRPAAASCAELANLSAPPQDAPFQQVYSQGAEPPPQGQLFERQGQVSSFDAEAWSQNREANQVYQYFRSGKKGERAAGGGKPSQGQVEVRTAPFVWRTVEISREPSLVALRQVDTPDGRLIQGFWVSKEAVAGWLAGDRLAGEAVACSLEPGAPAARTEAALPLAGAAWKVRATPRAAEGAKRAKEVLSRFLRVFAGGAFAAAFAGLLVIGLVWQSERLALQRSQFAASAAHELRTPLAGLRMYAEMLAEGLGDPVKAPSYARRLAEEAERLGRVVANVLGFSRLERGSLNVRPEPGDLADSVAKAVDRQRPALEGAGVRLSAALEPGLPAVRFDADAVAQIVQNLLDNAEKYGRGGADRSVEVAVRGSGSGVELSISDRGPGIPPSLRRRLFHPFARGEGADDPAGLGIGLALVKALADAQGARVACENRPGGGTVFRVAFPI